MGWNEAVTENRLAIVSAPGGCSIDMDPGDGPGLESLALASGGDAVVAGRAGGDFSAPGVSGENLIADSGFLLRFGPECASSWDEAAFWGPRLGAARSTVLARDVVVLAATPTNAGLRRLGGPAPNWLQVKGPADLVVTVLDTDGTEPEPAQWEQRTVLIAGEGTEALLDLASDGRSIVAVAGTTQGGALDVSGCLTASERDPKTGFVAALGWNDADRLTTRRFVWIAGDGDASVDAVAVDSRGSVVAAGVVSGQIDEASTLQVDSEGGTRTAFLARL